LKIAVCDDNNICLSETTESIRKWISDNNINAEIFSFDNGDDLLKKCVNISIDIVFLDIIMPLLNGMDTAKELRSANNDIRIVFLTSSPEFALESYSVKATGYILKPVSYEKIQEALDECLKAKKSEPKSIVIRSSFGFHKVFIHNIEYIEAQNKKVVFYLSDGTRLETSETLSSFENKLTTEDGFFKCHRSYIVYLKNMQSFNSNDIITKTGRKVPIARGYAKPLHDAYFADMFND